LNSTRSQKLTPSVVLEKLRNPATLRAAPHTTEVVEVRIG
jgi:hypothetical protein